MKNLRDYDIAFSGLALGKHEFEFELNDAFFTYFGFEEYQEFKLKAAVVLNKANNMLEIEGMIEGTVVVPCDLSNELFPLSLHQEFDLVIKFGDTLKEDDEVIVLPFSEHKWNIGQTLYEWTVLAIPAKKVHPGIEDGSLELDYEWEEETPEQEEEENVDPRWAKLRDLRNDNND
jgi:uncharacterized metal-binding protein YceD (DUF177 family)